MIKNVSQKTVFKGFHNLDILTYQEDLGNGVLSAPITRELLIRPAAVAVLTIDPKLGTIVFVKQFRPAAHVIDFPNDQWEPVAGLTEPGDSEEDTARRECLEEIGVEPYYLEKLFSFMPMPSCVTEKITLYLGYIDSHKILPKTGLAEEGEFLETHSFTLDEAITMFHRGEFSYVLNIIAMQWLILNRNKIIISK